MKKFLLSSLAALSIFVSSSSFAWDVKKMDAQINNDLYVLKLSEGICSAFDAPKQGRVITAAHCVGDALEKDKNESIVINSDYKFPLSQKWVANDGSIYNSLSFAKLIDVDLKKDVAVLEMLPNNLNHKNNVKIREERPIRGEDVYVAGAPFGQINNLSKGIVSDSVSVLNTFPNIYVYRLDAFIGPGNSGGPVYDTDGNVIGVISSIIGSENGSSWSYAIPIKFIDKTLIE